MTDDQQQKLTALLRLKRFEQPPAGYFDKLLQDVHRRQRAELLHRPLWQIAVERVQTFFGEHSMGQLSYAGAMAAVVVTGLTVIGVAIPGRQQVNGSPTAVAEHRPVDIRATQPAAATPAFSLDNAPVRMASVADDQPIANARLLPTNVVQERTTTRHPRYVIDNRPATSEAIKASFNF